MQVRLWYPLSMRARCLLPLVVLALFGCESTSSLNDFEYEKSDEGSPASRTDATAWPEGSKVEWPAAPAKVVPRGPTPIAELKPVPPRWTFLHPVRKPPFPEGEEKSYLHGVLPQEYRLIGAALFASVEGRFLAKTYPDDRGRFVLPSFDVKDDRVELTAETEQWSVKLESHRNEYGHLEWKLPESGLEKTPGPSRPGCGGDRVSGVFGRFIPGSCLGLSANDVAALPYQMSYRPSHGSNRALFRIERPGKKSYTRDLFLLLREENGVMRVVGLDADMDFPKFGPWAPRLEESLRLLAAAFGDPEVKEIHQEARPDGDGHCGTPIPASKSSVWQFPAHDGLEARVTASSSPDAPYESYGLYLQRG